MIEPAVYNPATGATVNPTYQYTYDAYGDLTSSTDALGRVTQYGYDQFGNMVSETLPMGGQSETWNYNSLDQLTSQTDFDGNTTDYTYYGTGSSSGAPGDLETKTVYAAGSQTPYETVTYAYNVNYNAQGEYHDTVTDSLSGTTTSEYDVNGNLIQVSSPQGTINYTYDPATGNEIGISTSNTSIQYSYDQAGEMKSATVSKLDGQTLATPLVTSYSYDLDGNLVSTQNANGTTETRTYNNLNELTSIVDTGSSGTIASFAYTYDSAGNVLTETDFGGRTDTFQYDNLYRLIQQSVTDPVAGNSTLYLDLRPGRQSAHRDRRFRLPDSKRLRMYTITMTRLSTVTGPGSYQQTYTYDADGNTLTVTGTGGASSATYTWDPRGRMISATTGGVTTSFTYNDSDDRTSETVGGNTTTFLNDPNRAYDEVLEQYAPGGVLAATYIQGLDLLFQDRSGARSFYVTDNIGSTRAHELSGRGHRHVHLRRLRQPDRRRPGDGQSVSLRRAVVRLEHRPVLRPGEVLQPVGRSVRLDGQLPWECRGPDLREPVRLCFEMIHRSSRTRQVTNRSSKCFQTSTSASRSMPWMPERRSRHCRSLGAFNRYFSSCRT